MDNSSRGYWFAFAPILVISAGVLWGIMAIFLRSLSGEGLSALQITEIRCSVSAIVLLLFSALTDRKRLMINVRDIWLFVGMGAFSIAMFNICYFFCVSKSTLAVACILLYTAPCFVMLLSCLILRERFTVRKGIAIALAFAGCICVTGIIGGGETRVGGIVVIVGLGAGVGYALYSVIGKVALRKYGWLTVITYTFLFAAIALVPFSEPSEIFRIIFSKGNVTLNVFLLCLLSTLLPFLLYTKGLQHMETSKAALLTFVEPVVTTAIGVMVFNEAFTGYTATGIMLVISSIVVIRA